MDNESLVLKLQETSDRSVRNEERIEKLEKEKESLHKLATSVAVMAEHMKNVDTNVATLTVEVEELKDKPGKRWEKLLDVIIAAVGGVIVGYIFSQFGM